MGAELRLVTVMLLVSRRGLHLLLLLLMVMLMLIRSPLQRSRAERGRQLLFDNTTLCLCDVPFIVRAGRLEQGREWYMWGGGGGQRG